MGFDIHGVFQKRDGNRWVDTPSDYDYRRDEHLYWWLSSTRTSRLKPLSQPRGLPDDFVVDANNFHPTPDGHKLLMGEWGFSWLRGAEVIAAPPPIERMTIWMPIVTYHEWDKASNPKLWHELHANWHQHDDADLYATPRSITENTWRVIVEWDYDFTEDFGYFVKEVRRLTALYGDVRFVFGFNA